MPVQDDEYELMPREELDYLRKEVEKLKRNPLGDTQASIGLLEAINKLNANIVRLNEIFAGANDDMVKAFNENALHEQMHKITEQNEKLARGIVAVGELVKKVEEKQQNAPLPTIEQFAPPRASTAASVQISPQTLAADLNASTTMAQPRNPFEAPMSAQQHSFTPIMSEPLPRSNAMPPPLYPSPGMPPPLNARPGMSGAPQMSPPGLLELDVPPPPPRRNAGQNLGHM